MCFQVVTWAEIDTWGATLRIKFDTNAFTPEEVLGLVKRSGLEGGTGFSRRFYGRKPTHNNKYVVCEDIPTTVTYLHKKEAKSGKADQEEKSSRVS